MATALVIKVDNYWTFNPAGMASGYLIDVESLENGSSIVDCDWEWFTGLGIVSWSLSIFLDAPVATSVEGAWNISIDCLYDYSDDHILNPTLDICSYSYQWFNIFSSIWFECVRCISFSFVLISKENTLKPTLVCIL